MSEFSDVKLGDKVRITEVYEGEAIAVSSTVLQIDEGPWFDIDDNVVNRTIEVLKPEPKPGEAWLVEGMPNEVMFRVHGGWRDFNDHLYDVGGVTAIRKVANLNEDG